MPDNIKNTLIYLIGFPATGKLTLAKLLAQKTGTFLVDNHAINNPIFQLVRKTGKEKLDDRIWAKTAQVREVVLETMVEIADPTSSFVMTNALAETESDRKLFENIEAVAKQRNAMFVPIKLTCDHNVMLERVTNPDRVKNMKLTHIGKLRIMLEEYEDFKLQHENMLEIDTSTLSPEENAELIINHVSSL